MSKVNIIFEITGTILTVDVTYQDPSIIRKTKKSPTLEFRASNGIAIRSLVRVGAYPYSLYLQGSDNKLPKNNCASIQLKTREEALEQKALYIEALKEWKEAGYFKTEIDEENKTVLSF